MNIPLQDSFVEQRMMGLPEAAAAPQRRVEPQRRVNHGGGALQRAQLHGHSQTHAVPSEIFALESAP